MALLINLPPPQDPPVPDFTIGVELDGAAYTLRFFWSPEDATQPDNLPADATAVDWPDAPGRWYMRVLDDLNQNVLMGDVRVVADWPLYRSRPVRTPPGLFVVRDTTGQAAAPTLDGFGTRWQLFYVTAAEVAAMAAGATVEEIDAAAGL